MLRPDTVLGKAIRTLRDREGTDPEEVFDRQFLDNLSNERKQFWANFYEKVRPIYLVVLST